MSLFHPSSLYPIIRNGPLASYYFWLYLTLYLTYQEVCFYCKLPTWLHKTSYYIILTQVHVTHPTHVLLPLIVFTMSINITFCQSVIVTLLIAYSLLFPTTTPTFIQLFSPPGLIYV